MNAKELAEAVKRVAFAEGADMAGVASVSRYEGAPEKLRPQAHMPEAKAVVVMAVHHPDASIDFGAEPNSNFSGGFQIGMIPKLDTMALRVAKHIERLGYAAVPLSCTFYWRHRKWRGVPYDHAASFSHMNAFVAAGLGEYGWHGMAMSPKYGPRQRIISVITDAPLAADPLYNGEPLCDRCGQCERACWGENYKKPRLLSPETISFVIEGKKFEYANVNRWRCFWGEQCHLDMRRLAERDSLDESGIYQAIDEGVKRTGVGGAGYMCSSLKFCMSKPVRRWDKSKAANPLRKKPAPSSGWDGLKKEIVSMARAAGADRLAINPIAPFEALRPNIYEGFRADSFFKSFKWVISIGRALPASLDGGAPLAERNRRPIETLTSGRMMTGTLDIARFLDDKGYDAMQDGWLFGISQFASGLSGWNAPGQPKISVQSIMTDAPLEEFKTMLPGSLDDVPADASLQSLKGGRLPHVEELGVAKVGALGALERREIERLMPEARSLVVLGAELPRKVVELAGAQEAECAVSYQYVNYQAAREAFWAAQDIASRLAKEGHRAEPLFEIETKSAGLKNHYVGTLPDLRAQAPFAAAAGLGFIGRSGFLMSPEAGPRQRFAFVLTSAELPATGPVKGSCPEGCKACADACPVKALDAGKGKTVFKRDESRCEWARVLGMVEAEGSMLIGWRQPELPVPEKLDEAAREQALKAKDTIAARCYEDPYRAETPVERCLQACPLGKSAKRLPVS